MLTINRHQYDELYDASMLYAEPQTDAFMEARQLFTGTHTCVTLRGETEARVARLLYEAQNSLNPVIRGLYAQISG